MNYQTKFLDFEYCGKSASGLTERWTVKSKDGATLAWIEWYAPWRRYVAHPVNGTLFDAKCLQDIVDFLRARMAERKNSA